jgi:ABC-type sugar transport system permease subunit
MTNGLWIIDADDVHIYLTGLRNFNQGYASAMAYFLLIAMMIIAMIFFRRMRQNFE